jgi:hypothetical protein
MKVEQVFVNRSGEKSYYAVTTKDQFEVYDDKLDLLFKGSISDSPQGQGQAQSNSLGLGNSNNEEVIRTGEYNEAATHLFLGTD